MILTVEQRHPYLRFFARCGGIHTQGDQGCTRKNPLCLSHLPLTLKHIANRSRQRSDHYIGACVQAYTNRAEDDELQRDTALRIDELWDECQKEQSRLRIQDFGDDALSERVP